MHLCPRIEPDTLTAYVHSFETLQVEARLRQLEGRSDDATFQTKGLPNKARAAEPGTPGGYNTSADIVMSDKKKRKAEDSEPETPASGKKSKKEKKEKSAKKSEKKSKKSKKE